MIEFITLFLGGIVTGPTAVELMASADVAAVEIRLDEKTLTSLGAAPWQFEIDFGTELEPHVLDAIAYDDKGRELGRARQWINLAPHSAEIGIVLDRNLETDVVTARMSWQSITVDGEPLRIRAFFDDELLEVVDPRSIQLPVHDPGSLHHLRVELDFPDSVRSSAEVTFGGVYGDTVSTELTPVPVALVDTRRLPPIDSMQSWFRTNGHHLTVHAGEKGPAEIVVVRDPATIPLLQDLMARQRLDSSPQLLRKNQRLRFLAPASFEQPVRETLIDLFRLSAPIAVGATGLIGALASETPDQPQTQQIRVADAVAVAGLSANQTGRRRAVVLITTGITIDHSLLSPQQARQYLSRLGVPLVIWNPLKGAERAGDWGAATSIFPAERVGSAYRDLTRALERQRIVWLNGLHLPQTITLDPSVEHVELVR